MIFNYVVVKPNNYETPQVTLEALEDSEIVNKKTSYKEESINQPITTNSEINDLINQDYASLSENYNNIDYEILTDNELIFSILIKAGDNQYPFTYSHLKNKSINLKTLFLDEAYIKNIINLAINHQDDYLSNMGVEGETLVVVNTDNESQNIDTSLIAGFSKIEVLEEVNPAIAAKEFQRREEQMLAAKTEKLIANQLAITKDSHDCLIEKCVALTFDDGPGLYTERLLDILSQKQAPSTFYVLGQQVAKYPEIARRIANEGHTLGNHTYHHPDLQTLEPEEAFMEIVKTQDLIFQTTNHYPLTYRPPYGSSKDVSEIYKQDEILWNTDTLDWKNKNISEITRLATSDIAPGSIILMHDIYETTVEAVPSIIEILRAEGFVFVTVEDLLINGQDYRPNSRKIKNLESLSSPIR